MDVVDEDFPVNDGFDELDNVIASQVVVRGRRAGKVGTQHDAASVPCQQGEHRHEQDAQHRQATGQDDDRLRQLLLRQGRGGLGFFLDFLLYRWREPAIGAVLDARLSFVVEPEVRRVVEVALLDLECPPPFDMDPVDPVPRAGVFVHQRGMSCGIGLI